MYKRKNPLKKELHKKWKYKHTIDTIPRQVEMLVKSLNQSFTF